MTTDKIKELQDKSIRNVPIVLWNRFAGGCKAKGMTVTEGIIEALNMWLNKD